MPLADRLNSLPLILAGPILRRVEPTAVTVWVALKAAQRVTLRVYGPGSSAGSTTIRMEETANTIPLGANLHILAITAPPVASAPPHLSEGEIYHYNLFFTAEPGTGPVPEEEARGLNGDKILNDASAPFPQQLHYVVTGMPLPSFALPPAALDNLRIIHGSCRKPHGQSADMLPHLDALIENTANDPLKRPHQLFLTGDQIYADDVASALLEQIMADQEDLLSWKEILPGINEQPDDPRLKPGEREDLAQDTANLTSGEAGSHLFKLGEYYMMYLLAWSDILWGINPDGPLKEFRAGLSDVRRALANVPCYMICDDHEVTDDWNLNLQWCSNVLRTPLGHRVLLNGILAFALFQAWGNTPKQFESNTPGEKLLQAVVQWRPSTDPLPADQKQIGKELAKILCVAGSEPNDDPLKLLRRNRSLHVLHNEGETLDFHFMVTGPQHQVIVLDTRTWRAFPGDVLSEDEIEGTDDNVEDGSSSAALLNTEGLKAQIRKHKPTAGAEKTVTFVVSPGPVMSVRWVLRSRTFFQFFPSWLPLIGIGEEGADYEDWEILDKVVRELLASLADFGSLVADKVNTHIVFLSGDIHFGYTTRMRYAHREAQAGGPPLVEAIFTQLNASAFHNEARGTRFVQFAGYELTCSGLTLPIKDNDDVLIMHNEMKYIVATPETIPDPESLPRPLPGDSPTAAFQKTAAISRAQKAKGNPTDPIEEVVGINNFGDVTFTKTGDERVLIHTLHWNKGESTSKYHIPLTIEPF
jgi:hypothetical protein